MRMCLKKCISIICLFTATSCQSQSTVYDGFETPDLSNKWTKDRMVKGALEMQSAIVRKGNSAAKMTLKTGDVFEAGSKSSKSSERDELRENKKLESPEGKTYEYSFSLFLPDSFPIVPVRLVIAQWKQHCGDSPDCSDDSPVLAIRYVSGKLFITMQADSIDTKIYETKDEIRNKWLDFRFVTCFSRLNNGRIDAWLNEKQVINYKGVTCYSSKKGYSDPSHFYFKMGLYRDVMQEPMTIYIDEYQKKELKEQ